MSKQDDDFKAVWEIERRRPKFHHIIHKTDGRLVRESYVYSTLEGSVELWRTPSTGSYHNGYFGGVEIHSAKPLYDFASEPSHTNCRHTPTGTCWHDGSSMAFDKFERRFDSPDYIRSELELWHRDHITPKDES